MLNSYSWWIAEARKQKVLLFWRPTLPYMPDYFYKHDINRLRLYHNEGHIYLLQKCFGKFVFKPKHKNETFLLTIVLLSTALSLISSKRSVQENSLPFIAVSFMPLQWSLELARFLLLHIGLILLGKFTDQALIFPLITHHLSIRLMCIFFFYVVSWREIWHSFCLPFKKVSFLFC